MERQFIDQVDGKSLVAAVAREGLSCRSVRGETFDLEILSFHFDIYLEYMPLGN